MHVVREDVEEGRLCVLPMEDVPPDGLMLPMSVVWQTKSPPGPAGRQPHRPAAPRRRPDRPAHRPNPDRAAHRPNPDGAAADSDAPSSEPPEEEAALHHGAHEQCFIANSVKTAVSVEPQG